MNFGSLLVGTIALIATGCSENKPVVTEATLKPLTMNAIVVDRGTLVDFDTDSPPTSFTGDKHLAITELTTRVQLKVRFVSPDSGYVSVNGKLVPTNVEIPIEIASIDATSTVECQYISQNGTVTSIVIHTVPKSLPSFHVKGVTDVEGEIALTPGGGSFNPYLLLLDGRGQIIYYKRSNNTQLSDFKRYRFGSEIYYSYIAGKAILPIGYFEGQATIMDRNFSMVQTVAGILPNPFKGRGETVQVENHDFLLLGPNHYIASAYYGRSVNSISGTTGEAMIVSSLLQEVVNGIVTFEWDSVDHPELFLESEEGNQYSATTWSDYAHFNSIDVDPRDNNLIVSFRNLNSIFKIHRQTGEILWRYGGRADSFRLSGHQMPQGQHSARFTNDSAIVYLDNNTTCLGVPPKLTRFFTPDVTKDGSTICDQRALSSRVVKVKLDESNLTLTQFNEWTIPNPPEVTRVSGNQFESTSYRGSAQQLENGSLFIGFGTHANGERDALEIDAAGNPVFEIYFNYAGQSPLQSQVSSYRANFSPN